MHTPNMLDTCRKHTRHTANTLECSKHTRHAVNMLTHAVSTLDTDAHNGPWAAECVATREAM